MSNEHADGWLDLDTIIEDQLRLQVKISYEDHHSFLLANGLRDCQRVLDIGTGNGHFLRRLAENHPRKNFVGLDKRPHLIERFNENRLPNMNSLLADALEESADISQFDGILMRYFLLHVPNAKDILRALRARMKPGAHLWVIDVDLSDFRCEPMTEGFQNLQELVGEFCRLNSVDTYAGQNLGPLFDELGFTKILRRSLPFSSRNTEREDLCKFLKQETACYSHLIGRAPNDAATAAIYDFIDSSVRTRKVEISYGMILWHAGV